MECTPSDPKVNGSSTKWIHPAMPKESGSNPLWSRWSSLHSDVQRALIVCPSFVKKGAGRGGKKGGYFRCVNTGQLLGRTMAVQVSQISIGPPTGTPIVGIPRVESCLS